VQVEVPPTATKDGRGDCDMAALKAEEMTSKDYYFDSYAHFGIHEVSIVPLASILQCSVFLCTSGLSKD
jgi:hypothetical protein